MKRIRLLLFLFLGGALIFASCKKDNTDNIRLTTLPISGVVVNGDGSHVELTLNAQLAGSLSSVYEIGFILDSAKKLNSTKIPIPLEGDFSLHLDNYTGNSPITLVKDQQYYVKAYALTTHGVVYGDYIAFKASTIPSLVDVTVYAEDDPVDPFIKTGTTAILKGQITSDGGSQVTSYGVFLTNVANAADTVRVPAAGRDATGMFTVTATGLRGSTTYDVIFYAINGQGVGYSNEHKTFTTMQVLPPKVEFLSNPDDPDNADNPDGVSDIGSASFRLNARVIDDGNDPGYTFGFKYGTDPANLTTITDAAKVKEGTSNEYFTKRISKLQSLTVYRVYAWVKNSSGEPTVVEYSTAPVKTHDKDAPKLESVHLDAGSDYLDNQITFKLDLIEDGGMQLTQIGFYFGSDEAAAMASAPILIDPSTITDPGVYSKTVTSGITQLTSYWFKPFATNDKGTTYGDPQTITTGIVDIDVNLFDAQMNNKDMPRLCYFEMAPIVVDQMLDGRMVHSLTFLDRNLGATKLPKSSAFLNSNNVDASGLHCTFETIGYFYTWGAMKPQASAAAAASINTDGTTNAYIGGAANSWNGYGGIPNYVGDGGSGTTAWCTLALTNATRNPCPAGFKIPSKAEWGAAASKVGASDLEGLFTKFNVCITGDFATNGQFNNENAGGAMATNAFLWLDDCSGANTGNPQAYQLNSSNVNGSFSATGVQGGRKRAKAVRCVKVETVP